ncbi:hypothetical protein GCM10027403_04110 [Arthrobacter tecti]
MLQPDVFFPAHSGLQTVQTPTTDRLTVNMIGELSVRRGDTVLDGHALGGPKPRQIAEILLLNLGNPVSKDKLIELLWAGHPPAAALPTLVSYVSVLRSKLQPGSGKAGPLRTTTGGYFMDRNVIDVDLFRFNELVSLARQSSGQDALDMLHDALSIATAPLLGDELLPAWVEAERELHAARVLKATIFAAETAAALGNTDESVELAQRVLKSDPLNEGAWLCLILGLEQAGRHAEGLHSYERCRQALDRELGCTPGPRLKAAYTRLLQTTADGEGELADVLAALLTLHNQLSRTPSAAKNVLAGTPYVRQALRDAGNVIHKFVARAMTAA